MKKTTLAFAAAALLASGMAQAKEWKAVKIGVDVPYKPFSYKAPDGTLAGFEIELGDAVCEQAKLECEWVVQSFDGLIPALQARKFDAIISSMSINEKRKKQVTFSKPYYNTPTGFFAADGSSVNPGDVASLEGKSIGVQRGTIQDAYATKTFGGVADIKRYTSVNDVVQDLVETGRLDMVVMDFPVGLEAIVDQTEGFNAVGENVQLGTGVGVALRKRDRDLTAIFDKALDEVKTNGTYDAIMNKYFDYNIKK